MAKSDEKAVMTSLISGMLRSGDGDGLVGVLDALTGKPATYEVYSVDRGMAIFCGTEAQCNYVKAGYDRDVTEGNPGAVGETLVRPMGSG